MRERVLVERCKGRTACALCDDDNEPAADRTENGDALLVSPRGLTGENKTKESGRLPVRIPADVDSEIVFQRIRFLSREDSRTMNKLTSRASTRRGSADTVRGIKMQVLCVPGERWVISYHKYGFTPKQRGLTTMTGKKKKKK